MGGFQFIRFQAPFRELVLYISQRRLEFVRRYLRVSMGGEYGSIIRKGSSKSIGSGGKVSCANKLEKGTEDAALWDSR